MNYRVKRILLCLDHNSKSGNIILNLQCRPVFFKLCSMAHSGEQQNSKWPPLKGQVTSSPPPPNNFPPALFFFLLNNFPSTLFFFFGSITFLRPLFFLNKKSLVVLVKKIVWYFSVLKHLRNTGVDVSPLCKKLPEKRRMRETKSTKTDKDKKKKKTRKILE